jgi:CRISPR-associated protein Cas4/CRISPR-associated endonuclease Cas2
MIDTDDGRPEPIPISLVAHHAFCPRRAWLEAMGEHTDTHQMAVGAAAHAASDNPAASRPVASRAIDVASPTLGVVGRCDTVEWDEAGRATVVEHKSTPVRRRAEVTEPMIVQLALQVSALRDAGVRVNSAAVYFTEHRTRVPVPIGPDELALARSHVARTATLLANGHAPEPLEDDRRCTRCSHAGVCLPDERTLAPVRRRVLAADPDAQVVHLATPGARASVRAGRLRVHKADEQLTSVPLERVLAVVVHGNTDLSSGLVRELLWRRVPVVWCSSSGRVIGWAVSARSPNALGRVRQHVTAERGHLGLARQFIAAKIGNQATLLRRHGSTPQTVAALRLLRRRAAEATSLADIFGVEGERTQRGRLLHRDRKHTATTQRTDSAHRRLRTSGSYHVPPSGVRLRRHVAQSHGGASTPGARRAGRHATVVQGDIDQMNLDTVHRFLICYDIIDDHRRDRLAKTLQTYGDRVQYSVFLIDVKPAKLVRLRALIRQGIDDRVDSILICSLGPLADSGTRRIEFIGRQRPFTQQGPIIV